MIRAARLASLLLAFPAMPLAAAPKLPAGTPYCALARARPLFVSPMGEPFRAAPGQPYPSAAWLAGADRDHDGRVDRAEFLADADRFFRSLDRDRDGRLEPEELIAYERDVAPEIALYGPHMRDVVVPFRRARNGEGDYGGPRGAGRYAWLNIPEPVAATDEDGDRVIAAREFAAAAGRRFDLLDAGGRGLAPAALARTPLQQSIEGPCLPRPKPKKHGRPDDFDAPGDGFEDTTQDPAAPEPRR